MWSRDTLFVDKNIPGSIITRTVEPYQVGDNTVDTYSCVVLKGESISTVFKSQGHELEDSVHEYDDNLDAKDETVTTTESDSDTSEEVF